MGFSFPSDKWKQQGLLSPGGMLAHWRRNEMPSMVANVSMEHAAGVWD
jgi:hypothetical protein